MHACMGYPVVDTLDEKKRAGSANSNVVLILVNVARTEREEHEEGGHAHSTQMWTRKGNNDLPLLPVNIQSTPNLEFFSLACLDLMLANVSIGLSPEFSASAIGTASSASANARIAYCSRPGLYQACQRL
jgi:hypothetical protein